MFKIQNMLNIREDKLYYEYIMCEWFIMWIYMGKMKINNKKLLVFFYKKKCLNKYDIIFKLNLTCK